MGRSTELRRTLRSRELDHGGRLGVRGRRGVEAGGGGGGGGGGGDGDGGAGASTSSSSSTCSGHRSHERALHAWAEADALRNCTATYCPMRPPPRSTIAAAFSPDGLTLASTQYALPHRPLISPSTYIPRSPLIPPVSSFPFPEPRPRQPPAQPTFASAPPTPPRYR